MKLYEVLPMSPAEGPPLPRILKIRWPWKAWRESGEKEVERMAREISRGIHTPF